jgi:hypothetical protein
MTGTERAFENINKLVEFCNSKETNTTIGGSSMIIHLIRDTVGKATYIYGEYGFDNEFFVRLDNKVKVVAIAADDVVYIVDMLRGFIGHGFPDNYVACAKECYRVYERLKPKYRGIKSDKRRLEWQREVMTEIDKLCKKHKVKFSIDGEWTLSEGYLMDWLGRKYLEI